jgi:predicted metal-dependent phosphoesterase TrpH
VAVGPAVVATAVGVVVNGEALSLAPGPPGPSEPQAARNTSTAATTGAASSNFLIAPLQRTGATVGRVASAQMRIDLHTHSTVSDGTLGPAEVIEAAAAAGLDAVALTDHDNLAGWPEAAAAARGLGVEFVPGVEISCRWYGTEPPISLHLLGYWFDPSFEPLLAELSRVRGARELRAQAMVDLMRADGIDVTWEEVQDYAAGGTVGRPHLAQALIRRGLAGSVSQAFAPELLGRRWRVPKPDTDVFVALDLVRNAGGVSVFAHPRASRRGRVVPDWLIVEMSIRGLAGLEADHEDHSPEERAAVRALADDIGILATGSSDFHGANKPTPIGANLTDAAVFEALRAAAMWRGDK